MLQLNATHDPARKSWVDSANVAGAEFPIQNLPLGIFSRADAPRGGVAIGDSIFDVAAAFKAGLFSGQAARAAEAACEPCLNRLMQMEPTFLSALRARISELLRADGPDAARLQGMRGQVLVPMAEATLGLPCEISNYTDFLSSIHHTERAGKLKGLAVPVPPTFKYVPVAYHSRATSIVPSGTPVRRPYGQWQQAGGGAVRFGPSESLDYELELGLLVATGNPQGAPIPLEQAEQHAFGYCLLNDWSTKEIQWWEQMLGPFLGKSFATSISPWIVTREAMAPFRTPASPRPKGDPSPLPYLFSDEDQASGGLSIELEAWLLTPRMREQGSEPTRLTRTSAREMYWTFAQMVAHHTVNGCNLRTGDILGSGTLSGPSDESRGCLAEITIRGTEPLTLGNGEKRAWLQDGDEVIFRGRAQRPGYVSIGFGECRGRIEASAIAWLDDKRV